METYNKALQNMLDAEALLAAATATRASPQVIARCRAAVEEAHELLVTALKGLN